MSEINSRMCDCCKIHRATYQQNMYTKLCLSCFYRTRTNQINWNEENPDAEAITVWQYNILRQLTERTQ